MDRRSLDELESNRERRRIYRVVNPLAELDQILERRGLSPAQRAEVVAELSDALAGDLLDGPFQPKTRFNGTYCPDSRFSDGSFPVFYASDDEVTAREEKGAHVAKQDARVFGTGPQSFQVFSCELSGERADVTDRSWPFLTADGPPYRPDGHAFGKAVSEHPAIDALKAKSVRWPQGLNAPTFKRQALSAARLEQRVRIGVDPETGTPTFELL